MTAQRLEDQGLRTLSEVINNAAGVSSKAFDSTRNGFSARGLTRPGSDGRALGYLVTQCGWFFEGHRAENDILALIYLLGHSAHDGETILSKIMASAERQTYRVDAVYAPFETKDALKARGYRWDAAMRFWATTISEDDLEAERTWLMQDVYPGYGDPAFHPQSACERYR